MNEWIYLYIIAHLNFQLNENYEQPNKRTGKSNNKNWIDSIIICVRLFVIQFRICCDFRNACACPSNYCRKLINVRWDRIFLSNELNRVRCQFNPLQLQSKTQCKRIRTVHALVNSYCLFSYLSVFFISLLVVRSVVPNVLLSPRETKKV